jgi:3-hydroxyacyl-CoA dehydrogenase
MTQTSVFDPIRTPLRADRSAGKLRDVNPLNLPAGTLCEMPRHNHLGPTKAPSRVMAALQDPWQHKDYEVFCGKPLNQGLTGARAVVATAALQSYTRMPIAERHADGQQITARRVATCEISEPAQAALLAFPTSKNMVTCLACCEFDVKPVVEQLEFAASVAKAAGHVPSNSGLFAFNSRTLPVIGFAQAHIRCVKFFRMCFIRPVEKVTQLGIVRDRQTNHEAVVRAYHYVQTHRKIPIVVSDSQGFYLIRSRDNLMMEGITTLAKGIGSAGVVNWEIQTGLTISAGAMGRETPLNLSVNAPNQTAQDVQAKVKPDYFMQSQPTSMHTDTRFARACRNGSDERTTGNHPKLVS